MATVLRFMVIEYFQLDSESAPHLLPRQMARYVIYASQLWN